MITLTVFPEPEQVFEFEYESEYEIMKIWGLSLQEVRHGLETGELIQGRCMVMLSQKLVSELERDLRIHTDVVKEILLKVLDDQAISDIVDEYGGEVPREDIQTILGLTEIALRHHISRACKKITDHPQARQFLHNVIEYKARKNAMAPSDERKVVTKTKITITIEE